MLEHFQWWQASLPCWGRLFLGEGSVVPWVVSLLPCGLRASTAVGAFVWSRAAVLQEHASPRAESALRVSQGKRQKLTCMWVVIECRGVRVLKICPGGITLILHFSINSCDCRVANSQNLIFFFFLPALVQMYNIYVAYWHWGNHPVILWIKSAISIFVVSKETLKYVQNHN